MRKVTRIIGMMCMAAVLTVGATSCNKDDNKNSSFTFVLPAVENFSTGDRAYIDPSDGSKMKWWEGDQIMMYNLDATNPSNSIAEVFTAVEGCQGLTQTPYTGPALGERKDGGFFAFYPADKADVSILAQNNRGRFEVGPNQTISTEIQFNGAFENRMFMDPRGMVMANVADDFMTEGTPLVMKHIFGFLNMRVKSESGEKQVVAIKVHDKKVHLTGPIEINILDLNNDNLGALQNLGQSYANGDMPTFDAYWANLTEILQSMGYTSDGQGYDVTLGFDDADAFVPIDNSKKYFIMPLRPGSLLDGFDVTVYYSDDTYDTKSYTGQNYIIRPGRFTNVDVVL